MRVILICAKKSAKMLTVETTNAPLSSASLTIMPIPARLAAAAAAAAVEPPPLLLERTGSEGGEDVSVSAACRPLLDAATSILEVENWL